MGFTDYFAFNYDKCEFLDPAEFGSSSKYLNFLSGHGCFKFALRDMLRNRWYGDTISIAPSDSINWEKNKYAVFKNAGTRYHWRTNKWGDSVRICQPNGRFIVNINKLQYFDSIGIGKFFYDPLMVFLFDDYGEPFTNADSGNLFLGGQWIGDRIYITDREEEVPRICKSICPRFL